MQKRTKKPLLLSLVERARLPSEPLRALTGLRGLAAWWVVFYHFREALPDFTPAWLVAFISYGYLAVDLFFILSGYVIALNYSDRLLGNFSPSAYRKFLMLRLSRIYPLHLMMLLLFLITPLAVIATGHGMNLSDLHPTYFALSFLLMQGWAVVPGPAWNVPAWSISVEWLAYLCFPLLSLASLRLGTSARRATGLVVGFAALLWLAASLRASPAVDADFQWFGIVRCLLEFMMGIGIWRLTRMASIGSIAELAALAGAALSFALFAVDPALEYAVLPAGFALLILGLCQDRGVLARALRQKVLQWLGVVSYSTYMAHYLLKSWAKFALLRPGIDPGLAFLLYLLMVLAASWLLHALVERPGQDALRRRFASSRTATA